MKKFFGWMPAMPAMPAILVAGAFVLFSSPALSGQNKATTVIIVRHAEKAAAPAADPPLTAEGEARARALLDAVRDARVTAVITTQFLRTRATAAPTAAALNVAPEVVPTTGATHVRDVVTAIRKHAGETVLVVGHSNTVTEIVEALGAKKPPAICDPEYDNLYVVTVWPDGKAAVVRGKYGARTPVDASCGVMR